MLDCVCRCVLTKARVCVMNVFVIILRRLGSTVIVMTPCVQFTAGKCVGELRRVRVHVKGLVPVRLSMRTGLRDSVPVSKARLQQQSWVVLILKTFLTVCVTGSVPVSAGSVCVMQELI